MGHFDEAGLKCATRNIDGIKARRNFCRWTKRPTLSPEEGDKDRAPGHPDRDPLKPKSGLNGAPCGSLHFAEDDSVDFDFDQHLRRDQRIHFNHG